MRIYRKIMCLPLLPWQLIIPTFEKLRLSMNAVSTDPNQLNAAKEFLDYYNDQWLINEGPHVISLYGLETRTNSPVEGKNSKTNARLGNLFTINPFSKQISQNLNNI